MFIIDTNVVSELRKRSRADPNVLRWADQTDPAGFFLSSITLLEIKYGALLIQRRDPTQGELMLAWLARDIVDGFAGRILPIDEEVALASASLHVPQRRPDRHAYIAATAIVHNLTVVTRNIRDFESTGAKLFNPWTAAT
jgi:predicted nucleic acid-binding protein